MLTCLKYYGMKHWHLTSREIQKSLPVRDWCTMQLDPWGQTASNIFYIGIQRVKSRLWWSTIIISRRRCPCTTQYFQAMRKMWGCCLRLWNRSQQHQNKRAKKTHKPKPFRNTESNSLESILRPALTRRSQMAAQRSTLQHCLAAKRTTLRKL